MAGHLFIDFDGTIALADTTLRVLERFADPEWRAVEAEWEAGRIGSYQCMARQVAMITAQPDEIDALLDDVPLDGHLPALLAFADRLGAGAQVLSDGLDRSVRRGLERSGVDIGFRANRLEWMGEGKWRLGFPYREVSCEADAAHCKCMALGSWLAGPKVLIGDGGSDFCAAHRADFVFAKGKLANYCAGNYLPFQAFTDLSDVLETLTDRWLEWQQAE